MKAVSLRPEKISVGIRDFQLYDIFVQFIIYQSQLLRSCYLYDNLVNP